MASVCVRSLGRGEKSLPFVGPCRFSLPARDWHRFELSFFEPSNRVVSKDARTSLAQKGKFCSGSLVDTIGAIGLLVRKHFCALSATGQVGLKVGGPHPPVLGPRELEQLSLRQGGGPNLRQSFMAIGFEARFDGHLAVRGGCDRHRRPLGEFVDRDLFTFIDGSTDLEGTCHGTKKLIGTFTRRVDRVGGNTDSHYSPTNHPHSRVRLSGSATATGTKENPRNGEKLSCIARPSVQV